MDPEAMVGRAASPIEPSRTSGSPEPVTRTPSPLRIRDAGPADCARIAEIYNQAIRSGRSTMDTEPFTAERFRAALAAMSPREAVLVGETAAGVVGYGLIKRYSDRPGYAVACETSVYLAEDETSRGYGALLVEALVERARQARYRHLVAKIMAVNEASVRFHQREGFEVVGRQREIGWLAGVWHDVVILQRILEDVEPA